MAYIYQPYPKWVKGEDGIDFIVETKEVHDLLKKKMQAKQEEVVKIVKRKPVKKKTKIRKKYYVHSH